MATEKSEGQSSSTLGLGGLVHVWGPAGAGKSLLAVAIAAEASVNSHVEWISTDGKLSFIPHLKRNVAVRGGRNGNVVVTMTENHNDALDSILNLVSLLQDNTAVIIVDPVTRVVDMARIDPTMWGEELIEEALPTLAAVADMGSTVLVTSECRSLVEGENTPVHHQTIRRWVDKEILIQREMSGRYSTLTGIEPKSGAHCQAGRLRLLDTGFVEISSCELSTDTGRNQ